jgi:hypothetical protein
MRVTILYDLMEDPLFSGRLPDIVGLTASTLCSSDRLITSSVARGDVNGQMSSGFRPPIMSSSAPQPVPRFLTS